MVKNKKNNNFSSFIFNELSKEAKVDISNLLNVSIKDLSKISTGKKELSMKEINILCRHTNVKLDNLYSEYISKIEKQNIKKM